MPFDFLYMGQTPRGELVTRTSERDGYRLVLTQEFQAGFGGGAFFYAIFDAAGNLRHISQRDGVYMPVKDEKAEPPIDGRVTQELADYILAMHIPKMREHDERMAKEAQG